MIRLEAGRIEVADREGQRYILDLDTLHEQIVEALDCEAVPDRWLADHGVMAVQEYYENLTPDERAAVTREKIDVLVAKMLVDAGYPDVAWRFAEQSDIHCSAVSASPQLAWDIERVHEVLRDGLNLAPSAAGELAERVYQRLQGLGFALVSDTLIQETGRHVLQNAARRWRSESRQGDWLMPAGYWQMFFPEKVATLVDRGILVIHPFDALFPLTWLTFDVAQLARERSRGAVLTELRFLPALREGCMAVAEAIDKLKECREERTGAESAPTAVQIHVIVKGTDSVVKEGFRCDRKDDAARLQEEIHAIVDECIAVTHSRSVIVSVQS